MSISKEAAEQMQARVNAGKLRSKQRCPETAATVGAKAERGSVAATGQPKRKEIPTCVIGIDPGTNTGCAVCYLGNLHTVDTIDIFTALRLCEQLHKAYGYSLFVRFEDARLRKWFGKSGPEKWKGAGSIMRDCAIWEETLTALGIPFEKVAPKDVKETTSEQFQKLTGWKGRTSIHAREAAWLVLPFLKKNT